MTKKKRDILYSIIFLVLSIVGIIYADVSIDQSVVEYTLARPDRYVQIWLAILGILSLILLIRTLRRKDEEIAPKLFYSTVVLTIVLFALLLIAMPYIGYTISSFLFLSILTFYYNLKAIDRKPDRSEMIRILVKVLIYSAVLAVGTGLLFRKVLLVSLPDFLF